MYTLCQGITYALEGYIWSKKVAYLCEGEPQGSEILVAELNYEYSYGFCKTRNVERDWCRDGIRNMPENDKLQREQKMLEINMAIGRPEGFPSNELNTRSQKTRAIPVLTPVIPLRSSTVPLERVDRLDRLANEEEFDLELMNLVRNQVQMKKHISLDLDT